MLLHILAPTAETADKSKTASTPAQPLLTGLCFSSAMWLATLKSPANPKHNYSSKFFSVQVSYRVNEPLASGSTAAAGLRTCKANRAAASRFGEEISKGMSWFLGKIFSRANVLDHVVFHPK